MRTPTQEWIERDEEYHSEQCTQHEVAKQASLEGAPVPGEDGYEPPVVVRTPEEEQQFIWDCEDRIMNKMFKGKYD